MYSSLLLKVTYMYNYYKKKKKKKEKEKKKKKRKALVLSSWSRMKVWKVYRATFFLTTGLTKKGLLPFWRGLQGLSTQG